MLIWPSTTIAVALLLAPASRALDCSLQPGADWSPEPTAVTALSCVGASGFFVPSPLYRELRDPTTSPQYRLLEAELKLSEQVVAEHRSLAAILDEQSARLRADAEMYRRRYLEALDRETEAKNKLIEASIPSWYDSKALWLTIGIAAALAIVSVAK